MNLEDRLRTHMHSAEDLFVETGRSAGDISAAGHRRTRRNQLGGALAGGVLALGLVFGLSSALGGNDGERVAAPGKGGNTDLELTADGARIDTADDPIQDDPASIEIFEGPFPPVDLITGVDDGFAGLRLTDGVASAIRSDDGLVWSESGTTGVPEGIDVQSLVQADGIFGALFSSFDGDTGRQSTFLGTSANLNDWQLVQILPDESDVFLSGLAIGNDTVVSFAQVFSGGEEADGTVGMFAIVGSVRGPYDAVPFTEPAFGVDRVVHTSEGFAVTMFADGPPQTFMSVDGRSWSRSKVAAPDAAYATISNVGDRLVSVSNGDGGEALFSVFGSDDLGQTWSAVDLPGDVASAIWWSFEVRAEGSSAAVMLSGAGADELTRYELVATTGAAWESVDLEQYVPLGATVSLVAVSTEEALLQVFPAPIGEVDPDLAASSGVVDEGASIDEPTGPPAAPEYVRVPLR